MPPKVQAALPPADAPAAPPAPPAARRPRGLTSARFYSAVAAALEDDKKMSAKQVRAMLLAIKKVVCDEFAHDAKQVTVPHVCRFRMRKLAARSASTKIAFGKQVELKAREASRTLKSTPAKTVRDEFLRA